MTDTFQVMTGVEWIVKTSTSEGKHGIQCTAQNQLDDLDFADNLTILSHTHKQMQIKTNSVAAAASDSVGLNIYKGKSKILKCNTENTKPNTFVGQALKDVESFTYLGNIINERGGYDIEVKARTDKANPRPHPYN
ncbi:unnamed protein product [Schistosoma curassoni]|uniref:PLAT domain-containing protein n=1 Tax=Schistosoma curassoni TaxID=6186 RepID=A0A183JG91_9TREM|nr:unnamed protein product [Schistosoma curassoni]